MYRDIPFLASIFGRHEFIIRRIHSILGLVPIGGFLCFHLATNASILDGAETFQTRVDIIHRLGASTLFVLEWGTIFLPILFHGLIGLIIVTRGKRNLRSYPYGENWRYTLQRWTGGIAMAFILYHVFQMHGWFRLGWWTEYVAHPLGGALFVPENATLSVAAVLHSSKIIVGIYVLGILAAVYHLANGLWTMGITWGLWTTPHSQRWANVPCALFGAGLLVVGWGALYAFLYFKQPLENIALLLGWK
jgi:succinate dehydrogenase / fumarate reductase, cytochrome b subunit